MKGQKRPTTERTKAVSLAVVHGIAEASRQTGIPESTVRQWYQLPEFAELRARNNEEVTAEWWAGIQKAFRRSIALLEHTDDPVKAATAGAIMFDKMALSLGHATSRIENRSLTDGLDDHETEVLGEVIRAELARRTNPDAAEAAVAGTGEAGPATTTG